MYIIAKDGTGDFTTLQAAIDAIPADNDRPVILLLRMDTYQERVVVNRSHVRIVGEARDRTVITASACALDPDGEGGQKGTFRSATLLVTGTDVEVENLTIRNDAGDGREVGQAVAVYAAGDRGVWRNVRMTAHQDTLFCGPTMPKVARDVAPRIIPEGVESVGDCPPVTGRQYFEDCIIQGDVDFIFGPYTCFFERCTLHMNARGGWYTAANTPEETPFGLVFHRCRLTGECGAGQAYLGRPWRKFARTVFLHCEMDECVSPEGFQDWGDKPVTERCGEFGTIGARADQATRHPGQKRLTEQEAAAITLQAVLAGADGFRPDVRRPTAFLAGDEDAHLTEAEALRCGCLLEDLSVPGAGAKSFATDKRLNFAELCLRRGDVLLVQLGRHDADTDAVHFAGAEGTYPLYLRMYLHAAQRQGARVALIPSGTGPHAQAMRALAEECGVPLADSAPEALQLAISHAEE